MLFLSIALAALEAQPRAPRDPQPIQPIGSWISDGDYPSAAIQREVSGTVGFRLDVGADGTPTRCTITVPADPDLDRTTCWIFMTRARFHPARDGNGRPVAGTYSSRLRWLLPPAEESPPPLVALHRADMLTLDASGNVTCSVSIDGGERAQRPAGQCGFLSGSGADAVLRERGTPGQLILVYTLVPRGATVVRGNEAAVATLISEATAQLVIAPDGTVAECRPEPARNIPNPLTLRLPPVCWMQGRLPFVAPAAGPDVRRAETSIRVYFRPRRAR